MGSRGKRKDEARCVGELTGTLSETVNSRNSVNKMLTLTKFKQPLQRISDKHRAKAEEVAKEHGRRTFNDVLDIYVFCYEFVKELSVRLGVPIHRVPEEVEKYIPQDDATLIGIKLTEFLDSIKLNGSARSELEGILYKIIFDVKVKKRKLEDVRRILAVLGE